MADFSGILKKVFGLAGATFLSRILGFGREILTAQILGGGAVASAWEFAFMVPNLCRRIFAEGLLAQVLVPVVTHALDHDGVETARKKFSTVFCWSGICLGVISILVAAVSIVLSRCFTWNEHWKLALNLIPLLIPYSLFICSVGIMTSVANCFREFIRPALVSLLLNVCMLLCLAFICPLFAAEGGIISMCQAEWMLDSLGVSVLLSGVIEVVLMLILLKKLGMMPVISGAILKDWSTMKEILILILPGLAGAVSYQVGVTVDRTMAMSVGDYAVAALGYSERLTYLPIGVIAVAFGSVSLTEMSHSAARGDLEDMSSILMRAMRVLLFLTIPLSAFILVDRELVIRLCFMRGAFQEQDVQNVAYALACYSFGIPAFAAMKISLAAFYSRKETKTPMMVSICCIVLNIIMNLILMGPLKHGGIALATVISSYINNITLLQLFRRQTGIGLFGKTSVYFSKLLILSILPAEVTWLFAKWISLPMIPQLIADACVFGMVFLVFALLTGVEEVRDVCRKIPGLSRLF